MNRRPGVIASYLVFLPLPLLIGIFGSIQGFIASYSVIAASTSTPKPSEVAAGISTALFTSFVGLFVSFPAYFVLAFGLFLRAVAWPREPLK
jgi:biopolymer transport protein ExbB